MRQLDGGRTLAADDDQRRSKACLRSGASVTAKNHPGMWRSVKVDGILSDSANLSWSKDNVMAQAIREVAWNVANYPQKCPVKRGSREQKSPPMRLNAAIACQQHRGRFVAAALMLGAFRRSNHPQYFVSHSRRGP